MMLFISDLKLRLINLEKELSFLPTDEPLVIRFRTSPDVIKCRETTEQILEGVAKLLKRIETFDYFRSSEIETQYRDLMRRHLLIEKRWCHCIENIVYQDLKEQQVTLISVFSDNDLEHFIHLLGSPQDVTKLLYLFANAFLSMENLNDSSDLDRVLRIKQSCRAAEKLNGFLLASNNTSCHQDELESGLFHQGCLQRYQFYKRELSCFSALLTGEPKERLAHWLEQLKKECRNFEKKIKSYLSESQREGVVKNVLMAFLHANYSLHLRNKLEQSSSRLKEVDDRIKFDLKLLSTFISTEKNRHASNFKKEKELLKVGQGVIDANASLSMRRDLKKALNDVLEEFVKKKEQETGLKRQQELREFNRQLEELDAGLFVFSERLARCKNSFYVAKCLALLSNKEKTSFIDALDKGESFVRKMRTFSSKQGVHLTQAKRELRSHEITLLNVDFGLRERRDNFLQSVEELDQFNQVALENALSGKEHEFIFFSHNCRFIAFLVSAIAWLEAAPTGNLRYQHCLKGFKQYLVEELAGACRKAVNPLELQEKLVPLLLDQLKRFPFTQMSKKELGPVFFLLRCYFSDPVSGLSNFFTPSVQSPSTFFCSKQEHYFVQFREFLRVELHQVEQELFKTKPSHP